MKTTIRSPRFTLGMFLFLAIILLLSVSSAYYLNKLSDKTNAILKENHYSVVYVQDMAEALTNLNQTITKSFIKNEKPDSFLVKKEVALFVKSFELEKNNITEPGEADLVADIETDYNEYSDFVLKVTEKSGSSEMVLLLQSRFNSLYEKLMLLSQMNANAIEEKTTDAKVTAKKFTMQMTFIGTLCFLIAYGFAFMFSSYFNERFYRLYNGIKEFGSGRYTQKLYLDGKDELSEISEIFNEMSEKILNNKQEKSVSLQNDLQSDSIFDNIQELKNVLVRIRTLEEETKEMISRIENR